MVIGSDEVGVTSANSPPGGTGQRECVLFAREHEPRGQRCGCRWVASPELRVRS